MKDLLKIFQKRLTNLTGNNKSLVHLRLRKTQDVDLNLFDFSEKLSSHEILESLIGKKKTTKLCSLLNARDKNGNELSKQLSKIKRQSNFLFEEHGSQNLYLGWPYVTGQISKDLIIRCPLLFYPISLEKTESHWTIRLRDEPINFNKSFLLAYAHYNQIKISNETLEYNFEELSGDFQQFKNSLYDFLKESSLEINFNQELFENKLIPFVDYKKIDLKYFEGVGQLKLSSNAVLGVFPQADSYLVPDYDQLIEEKKNISLEDFFISKSFFDSGEKEQISTNDPYRPIKSKILESDLLTPYRIDSSQEEAIRSIKNGASIVVQGPPGSGKSQLICNLICDFIGRKKRVLVVSQKRAALDVIYDRLREKDFHNFTALVHDFKSDRASVYKKITAQIEVLSDYKKQNNALDSIEIERKFSRTSTTIDQNTEELTEFKHALFNTEEFGKSIKELYLMADINQPHINLSHEYRDITYNDIDGLLSTFKFYWDLHIRLYQESHPLKNRTNFKSFGIKNLQEIKIILNDFRQNIQDINTKSLNMTGHQFSLNELDWVYKQKESLSTWLKTLNEPSAYAVFRKIYEKKTDYKWLLGKEKSIYECFRDIGIENSVPRKDLGKIVEFLDEYDHSGKNFASNLNYKLFNKHKLTLQRVFVDNQLNFDRKGINSLKKKIDNRLNFEHFVSEMAEQDWVDDIPEQPSLEKFKNWFHNQFVALEAQYQLQEFRSLSQFMNIKNTSHDQLTANTKELVELGKEAHNKLNTWKKYFSPKLINEFETSDEKITLASNCLHKDFDAMCEYDKLKNELSQDNQNIFTKLTQECKNITEASKLFKNSLYITWIGHLETKYPILTIPSSGKLDKIETDLQIAIKAKRELSKQIALINLKENTYKNISFNRLNNRITYRELEHQVSKKRQLWPIRKVIDQFTEELFDLMPCWLASPETVSAIFPLEKNFDLIIFDEASQCFTEKGIPAIARANQVVIAGDSQQLSPYDLYQTRYEVEDEIGSSHESETDSLLDIANKYLSPFTLKGHYRSKTLDLIDFSNQHFYNNELSLVQSQFDSNHYLPAIEFNYIENAHWYQNTNILEAEAVVKELITLINNGEDDIGVISFNYKQQQLITDLLEDAAQVEKFIIPEKLFIKNIENIQGDERKIILMSFTYAPSDTGQINMNFGSLNRYKGENRLNVAITRAQEKIKVFASILPHQLHVEKSIHVGPKLLKSYLEYVIKVSDHNWEPTVIDKKIFSRETSLTHILPQLSTKHIELNQSFPFADLTAISNKHYVGLILSDDEHYLHSKSIKEFHAYKPLYLKQKGWKIQKIHSRNYFLDKEAIQMQLEKFGFKNA